MSISISDNSFAFPQLRLIAVGASVTVVIDSGGSPVAMPTQASAPEPAAVTQSATGQVQLDGFA